MLERVLLGVLALPFLLGAAAAPSEERHVVFSFTDTRITEASGLVVTTGPHPDTDASPLFVTTNDSGDVGRVFVVDPGTGDTVGVTEWFLNAVDVEAVAPASPGRIWVGDIGDNAETRTTIQVAQIPVGQGDERVDPLRYDLVYPGPRDARAHNAETLMTDPTDGRLYVATKEVLGGVLYATPRKLRANVENKLTPVGRVLPIATDGAFFPDGKHIIVRNYLTATVYAFPTLDQVASINLPGQSQGEGIAVDPSTGRVYVDSEGQGSAVLRVSLPADLQQVVEPGDQVRPSPYASNPEGPTGPDLSRRPADPTPTALPETDEDHRPGWPWFLGGWIAVVAIVLLVRSLRPR